MEAGDIFCNDSIRFRSMKDDLLDDKRWENKEALIAEAGLGILDQPIEEHLAELKEQLETRIAEVNRRISTGENEHFKIKSNGHQTRWTLEYPDGAEAANHSFFDQLPQADIHGVLRFANRHCGFTDAFTHVLGRHARKPADDATLTACVVAWGTNMGLTRMGQISDIGQQYFGLKKGIVSYTAVANNVPINACNIGADDHESHFVFDILFNNSTDIQPEIHSTDTHGTNEVNFGLLYPFGYQFAPRYKDLCDKVRTSLTGFHHPSRYGDAVLKPARKIRERDIIREWDECKRIFVSLALKQTTQSTIIRKLSAHARNNRTKRALWEYDSIHRSLYLLNYIDSPSLRRNVQKAVNRGENYHQLRRAISFASFGKLRFKTEYEQDLWSECSRLIANCIIFYNAAILSRLLEHREQAGQVQTMDEIKKISAIAWQHISLQGRYEFQKPLEPLNLDAIIRTLTDWIPRRETPEAA